MDSYAGRVHVEWDSEAPLTPLGQLPFFVEFLKVAGLFDIWVKDCPLVYSSPNAPKTRDILGTAMLSLLAGHWRHAHIATLRGDGVLPALLGMSKVMSEDAVRRAFLALDEAEGSAWSQCHLDYCTRPLLGEPWILDVDSTVKPLYGHQQGAVLGYNPQKPGRPSHTYHSYFIGPLRLVLDVEVHAGNEHTSNFSAPDLWALLERIGRDRWPALLRGDAGFGNDPIMREAITSRPLFLYAIAAKTRHAGQTTLTIASAHAKARWTARVLVNVAAFLHRLVENAEQLTTDQRWYRILSHALRKYLNGRQLHPPPRLAAL